MDFVFEGALYYDKVNNEVVRPQSTCHGIAVDCRFYRTKEAIGKSYGSAREEEMTGADVTFIEVAGVKYYETDVGPKWTANLVLLSDLSSLKFFDEEDTFH